MEINHKNENIDLHALLKLAWSEKFKIIFITSIFLIGSILYALSLPNIYRSEALLASASDSGNISSIRSQYAAVASLAGIAVPTDNSSKKLAESIEIMNSLNFFKELSSDETIFFNLQAPIDWDENLNILIIDPSKFDTVKKKWISSSPFAINGKPSIQSAHREFLDNFKVSIDKQTGFVHMYFDHYSPHTAKEILNSVIEMINEISRKKDISIASNSINYLQEEANNASLNDVRLVINNLIQKQIETIALANATPQYSLKILSEPNAPEIRIQPKRALIAQFGLIMGLIVSFIIVLLKNYLFITKKRIDN